MADEEPQGDSLTDRKRRRAKEAIRKAALELFSERGFDAVSVADIAERAEVGRTTFFRYFGDKQEVLFSDPAEAAGEVTPEPSAAAVPIGSSMTAALAAARRLVVGYIAGITADAEGYERHQKLVSSHPELYARSLVKQRRYADELTSRLENWGRPRPLPARPQKWGWRASMPGRRRQPATRRSSLVTSSAPSTGRAPVPPAPGDQSPGDHECLLIMQRSGRKTLPAMAGTRPCSSFSASSTVSARTSSSS